MRKFTYHILLLYVCVVLGIAIELPGALGSVIRLSQLAAIATWALSLITVTHKVRRLTPLHALFGAFIVWNLVTYLWSMDPTETLLHFARYTMLFLMLIALWDVFRTPQQEQGMRRTIVLAGYVLVGICVINFRSGAGKLTDETRFSAGGLDPNDMGLILAVIIPIAWQLFLNQASRRGATKYLGMVYPAVALCGIMLSGSRGSLVAALPGLLFILCSYNRLPGILRLALPLVVVVGIAFGIKVGLSNDENISKNIARLASTAGSASDDKLSGRVEIWSAGWDVFTHHPILGVGSGAFPESTRRYPVPRQPVTGEPYVAHNTYLSIVTETGLVGLGIFLAAVIVVFRAVWSMEPALRWGWIASLTSLMVGVSSLSWDFRPYIWVFFMAAVIAATAARDEARRLSRSTASPLPSAEFRTARNHAGLLTFPSNVLSGKRSDSSFRATSDTRGRVS